MAARGGNDLQSKRSNFYHHDGVGTMVRGGCVCTVQLSDNSATGRAIPDAITGMDRDPTCGRHERSDRETGVPAGGVNGNQHCFTRPGVTGTTLHAAVTMPQNYGVEVEGVVRGFPRHKTGRLHHMLGLDIFT